MGCRFWGCSLFVGWRVEAYRAYSRVMGFNLRFSVIWSFLPFLNPSEPSKGPAGPAEFHSQDPNLCSHIQQTPDPIDPKH